MVRAMPDHAN